MQSLVISNSGEIDAATVSQLNKFFGTSKTDDAPTSTTKFSKSSLVTHTSAVTTLVKTESSSAPQERNSTSGWIVKWQSAAISWRRGARASSSLLPCHLASQRSSLCPRLPKMWSPSAGSFPASTRRMWTARPNSLQRTKVRVTLLTTHPTTTA